MYALLFLVLLVPSAYGQVEIECPKITEDQYPALVYMENFEDRQQLNLAYWDIDHFEVEELLFSSNVTVLDLGQQKFFVNTGRYGHPYHSFVLDFSKGKYTRIDYENEMRVLYTEPGQYVMMHYKVPRENDFSIYKFDFNTLKLTQPVHWTDEDKPDFFHGLTAQFQVSPDHQFIAALHLAEDKIRDYSKPPPEHTISVTDLETHKTRFIDTKISIELLPISSVGRGSPPFTWFSNHEIAFFDTDISYPREPGLLSSTVGTSTLKIADISAPEITVAEHGEYELPLTMRGGTLHMKEDKLFYNYNLEIDWEAKKIIKRTFIDVVDLNNETENSIIKWEGNTIYYFRQDPKYTSTSPSQTYRAYAIRSSQYEDDKTHHIYIQKQGVEDPFQIDKHSGDGILYMRWFE